jgi:hypothetical protein
MVGSFRYDSLYGNAHPFGLLDAVLSPTAAGEGNNAIRPKVEHRLIAKRAGRRTVQSPHCRHLGGMDTARVSEASGGLVCAISPAVDYHVFGGV